MAEVLLFHHVLGRTDGFQAFGAALRAAGHTVHDPDLFDGQVFDSIETGADAVDAMGFSTIVERGVAAAADLPEGLVYAGFSLGVLPAQKLAQTRAGARGALLFEACVPPTEFGERWPPGLPVQIHGMDGDPFFAGEGDIDAARALVEEVSGSGRAELFVYAGDQHLFADSSLSSFDPIAAELMLARVLDFLRTVA